MAGTAGDVLRFLEAIRAGGAPILDAGTVEVMVTDQVGMGAGTQGPGWGFGYGWAVLVDPCRPARRRRQARCSGAGPMAIAGLSTARTT